MREGVAVGGGCLLFLSLSFCGRCWLICCSCRAGWCRLLFQSAVCELSSCVFYLLDEFLKPFNLTCTRSFCLPSASSASWCVSHSWLFSSQPPRSSSRRLYAPRLHSPLVLNTQDFVSLLFFLPLHSNDFPELFPPSIMKSSPLWYAKWSSRQKLFILGFFFCFFFWTSV